MTPVANIEARAPPVVIKVVPKSLLRPGYLSSL